MNGVISLLPCRQVASGVSAVRWGNLQRVVAIDMALAALHGGVFVCQREARRAVVELSIRPCRNRVAGRAGSRGAGKAGRDVVRHISAERRRALPRRLMTAHAIGRVQRVIVVDMARRARSRRRRHMCSHQRKSRQAVVKRSGIPAFRRVAIRTIHQRKCRTRGRVHRVIRLLPRRQMATRGSTRRRRNVQRVVPIDVARCAGYVRVPVCKRKSKRCVIKFPVGPFRNGMA